ncbi:hypothetical protein [Butyrivibrio sp. AC2005]|uniref:hypothetical protein n=1 Tax=Butyrivibrio sp. AC2005 TaxID=1280672 RepID=UPI00040C52EC|nr:hypothetical protein [Butyrivibrio sp. AC2005]
MNMFSETKTLIVVSKDEMLINQFKKLVESDSEKYEHVKIVAWNEKVWIANKKSGNIDSKVLFIGDVKGVDKLIPVLDLKLDEYGVRYGWAGKQSVIYAEDKVLDAKEVYKEFFEKLESMPVPDLIKKHVGAEVKEAEELSEEVIEEASSDEMEPVEEDADKPKNKFAAFAKISDAIKNTADKVGTMAAKTREDATATAQDIFKDRNLLKRQMLFYGVIKMCDDDLKEFMES